MKIKFNREKFKNISPMQFMRRAGYHIIENGNNQTMSFVRRLSSGFYPRFHIYIKEDSINVVFNLHLDQKRVSYKGQTAHSGEYDSHLVEAESKRLKEILKNFSNN